MPFEETGLSGLLIYTPRVFEDGRGYFFESYNQEVFRQDGVDVNFIQDNQAKSSFGVVRGLHFQKPPHAQTKLIRVINGSIIDALVDLRKGSSTFGKSFSIKLSANNKKQLLVPRGFAHGYSVLEDDTIVVYKCDGLYHVASEGGLLLSDPSLNIDWQIPADKMIISDKDKMYPTLHDLQSVFIFDTYK